jgi:hypothetical protein
MSRLAAVGCLQPGRHAGPVSTQPPQRRACPHLTPGVHDRASARVVRLTWTAGEARRTAAWARPRSAVRAQTSRTEIDLHGLLRGHRCLVSSSPTHCTSAAPIPLAAPHPRKDRPTHAARENAPDPTDPLPRFLACALTHPRVDQADRRPQQRTAHGPGRDARHDGNQVGRHEVGLTVAVQSNLDKHQRGRHNRH